MTMNHFMRNALTSAIYLIFFMAAVVLFTLGPKIEAAINPVIGAFKVDRVWQEQVDGQTFYYAEGALLKVRGECEPTEIIVSVGKGFANASAKIVKVDFNSDPVHRNGGLVTRPGGSQLWGPWRLEPPKEPLGPIISVYVRHRCHSLWQQSQIIYTGLTKDFFPGMILDTKDGEQNGASEL